jgi:hypothetical protein
MAELSSERALDIEEARVKYGNDDIQIDDAPPVAQGETGVWVGAWVYVATQPERAVEERENQNEQTRDSQGSHSGVDGAATRQARDRGADRQVYREGAAAPRAPAKPPHSLSGCDGLVAATNR